MPYNHPSYGLPIWARDEDRICVGCGAEFHCYHFCQKYCSRECRNRKVLNASDKLLMERYLNLCAKYNLPKYPTFAMIAHEHQMILRELTKPILKNHNGGVGQKRKTRIMLAVKKFCDDLEAGKYDLVRTQPNKKNRVFTRAVRRLTPAPKQCPRNMPMCGGGFLPHSCPKQFRECQLA